MSGGRGLVDVVMGALELEGAARAAYLEAVRAEDAALGEEAARLVARHERGRGGLESVAATSLVEPKAAEEGPGTRLGPYKLLQQIGEGGFGTVYLAEQESPVRRRVALKIIKLGMDTRAVIGRFEAERQALAVMDHAHIAKVLDAGATGSGRPYFVMELVVGDPITRFCDRERLTIAERLALFGQVCAAVQHAHQKGIIHRDLKPSNVLVSRQDGRPFARVIDFGIAKATGARLTEKTVFTEHRAMIGTPEYMSPEQAEGSPDLDTRTDVYSLGVLLYELLTGGTPFEAARLRSAAYAEIERIIREEEPERPSTRLSRVDAGLASVAASRGVEPSRLGGMVRGELDWIVMKALEKDRGRRYESPAAMGADVLRHLSGEAVVAAPASRAYRARKFVRKHRAGVVTGVMVGASLVVGLGLAVWQAGVASDERDLAREAEREQGRLAEVAEKRADEATQRQRELELVAAFQESQLSGIDLDAMGQLLREDLVREAAEAARRMHGEAAESEAKAGMEGDLAGLNLSNVARRTLDRTIFDRALKAVGERFKDEPVLRARLLQTIGNTMRELGLPSRALGPMKEAVELYSAALGAEHQQTLAAVTGVGRVLAQDGHFEEAEAELRRAVEGLVRVAGADAPLSLEASANLAQVLGRRNKMKEVDTLTRDILERCRRVFGEDSDRTFVAMNERAVVLRTMSRLEEAEALYREALQGLRRVKGEEDTDTLTTTSNLAAVLRNRGRPAEAEPLLRHVMDTRRRMFGDDHPETLAAINAMGPTLRALGRQEEGLRFVNEAVAGMRRVMGPEHPRLLVALNNLAALYFDLGRAAEAEPIYREIAAIRGRTLGPDHLDTLSAMVSHAVSLGAVGRNSEEELTARAALARLREVWGPDHATTLHTTRTLATSLRRQSRASEAEPLYRTALEGQERTLGADHASTIDTRHSLAQVLKDLNRDEEAVEHFRTAAEASTRVRGPTHQESLSFRNDLGLCLQRLGRLDEAEAVQRELLGQYLSSRGPDHADSLRAKNNLAVTLLRRNRLDEALDLARAAADGSVRVSGERNALAVDARNNLAGVLFAMGRSGEAVIEWERAEAAMAMGVKGATADLHTRIVQRLVETHTALDAAEPGRGHAEKAAAWLEKLPKATPIRP